MKRILALTVIAVLLLPLVSIGAFAAASIKVNGPDSAYPGDEITVTVNLDADKLKNANAAIFEIVFDSEQITYKSNSDILSGWKLEDYNELSNGTIRFLISGKEKESIKGETLIKIKFKLSSSISITPSGISTLLA